MKACIQPTDDCEPAFKPFAVSFDIRSPEEAWALAEVISSTRGINNGGLGIEDRRAAHRILYERPGMRRLSLGDPVPSTGIGPVVSKLKAVGRKPGC